MGGAGRLCLALTHPPLLRSIHDMVVPHDITFSGADITKSINKNCGEGAVEFHWLPNGCPGAPTCAAPTLT